MLINRCAHWWQARQANDGPFDPHQGGVSLARHTYQVARVEKL